MRPEYFPSVNQGGTAAESNEFRSSLMELKMSSVKDDFFVFLRSREKGKKGAPGKMKIRPSLEEVLQYAAGGEYRRVPVSTEILADLYTPIQILRKLKNVSDHCYLLESAEAQEQWGRYTFLGFDPTMEITCLNGHMKAGALSFETKDPGVIIPWRRSRLFR